MTSSTKKTSRSPAAFENGLSEPIPVTVLETHGNSILVEFEADGLPRRSYVDAIDIVDGECPLERLGDVPYGIDWATHLDLSGIGVEIEKTLKDRGIWTLGDLQQKDRTLIKIATNLIGKAIWDIAKQQDKCTNS